MTPRRTAALALKVAIVLACVAWLVHDVELAALGHHLTDYPIARIACVIGVSLAAYAAMGLRLHTLLKGATSLLTCTCAVMLCLGLNNLLPARLGEAAKVVWLQSRTRAGVGRILGIVFWERLMDLNALLLVGLPLLASFQLWGGLLALVLVVGALWLAIAALQLWPRPFTALAGALPGDALPRLALDFIDTLRTGLADRRLLAAAGVTVVVWLLSGLQTMLVLLWAAELPISLAQGLVVFVAIAAAFAIPSAPGGLGVVEAAGVVALGWFGIPKDEALAAALLARACQFVPTTATALLIVAASDFSLASLRERPAVAAPPTPREQEPR